MHVLILLFSIFFLVKKKSLFFVSLYKKLLEPTFSVPLKVWVNLCEVLGLSIITHFISAMFVF